MDGRIGMKFDYLDGVTLLGGMSKTMDPDLVGIAPVPAGPIGQGISEINCQMMGIFSDIRGRYGYSPEEVREAAWKYIWFRDSEEARRIQAKFLVENGLTTTANPALLRKYGYEEHVDPLAESWQAAYDHTLQHGLPEPYGKNCQMLVKLMSYPLIECLEAADRNTLGATRETRLVNIKESLTQGVDRVNVEMLDRLEPAERHKRNIVAAIVATAILACFIFAVIRVWRIFTPDDAVTKGQWQFWRFKWAYIILLPAVLSIFMWRYLPMGFGSAMVVMDYKVVGQSAFVGLKNFADVLWDPVWWGSLGRTLYYMALIFTLGFWTPIALAILLTEVSRCRILYRTIYYLPAVLTGFVVVYLWKLFFDPSDAGLLNSLFNAVGLPSMKWLNDRRLAMLCCVIPTVWAGMGPGCLIYLAALKTVPDDLYEAADLDGCSFFGKIRYISLPTIKGIVIIQMIAMFIHASRSAGWILVMTFGGPGEATKVAGLHIFEKAYLFLRFGSAITMAWMFGVCLLIFTIQQLKILSRMEFRSAATSKLKGAQTG